MKKFLIIMQQNPYANSQSLECLELALALSSFNQPVTLLFKDDGMLQLLANQDTEQLVGKDFTKIYTDLPLFGINDVYIEENCMRDYGAQDLLLAPQIVDDQEIAALIKDHDVVIAL